jgi:putative ABC transport system permease protein
MRFLSDIRDGLISRPGRVFLSLLAIVLGVCVLAVLLSLLGGIRQKSEAIVQELGVNVLAVMPAQDDVLLDASHVDRLRSALPDAGISAVKSYQVNTRDDQTRLTVMAVESDLLNVRPWRVSSGRFLDPRDLDEGLYHCVISRELGQRMQWRVGQPLAIKDQYFTIVGMLETGNGNDVSSQTQAAGLSPGENLVIIPATIPPYWISDVGQPTPHFDVAYVKLPANTRSRDAVRICAAVLQEPGDPGQHFTLLTPEALVGGLRTLQKSIQLAAGALALLCMVLGGTTLASLMIANVQERVREIGLRLALGSPEWAIGALFMVEAIVLTLIAGLVGTVSAHLLLVLYGSQLPVPIALSSYTLFTPVVFAVLFGALFAWWPARQAARIRPADALRNE